MLSQHQEISSDLGLKARASIVMEIIFTYHLCAAIPSIPEKNIHQGPEKNAAHCSTPEVGLHKIDILFLNIIRLRTAKHFK
jgi:hypothetical protein